MTRLKSDQNSDTPVVTAIAIDRDKNSQYAVKWAVDHLISSSNKNHQCILLHVNSASMHSQEFDVVPKEGRAPNKDELQQFFLPYRGFCARKGIVAKEVVLHDLDVPSALICFAVNNSIRNVVVGASAHSSFMRKFRNSDVPTAVIKNAPDFCSVYVISSKGKVQSNKLATQSQTNANGTGAHSFIQKSQKALFPDFPEKSAQSFDLSRSVMSTDSWRSELTDKNSNFSDNTPLQTPYANFRSYFDKAPSTLSIDSHTSDSFNQKLPFDRSDFSSPSMYKIMDASDNMNFSSTSKSSSSSSSTQSQLNMETEIERLKQELKNNMQKYNSVCSEAESGRWKLPKAINEIQKSGESKISQEKVVALLEEEREKVEEETEAAELLRHITDLEAQKRMNTEKMAKQVSEERQRELEAFSLGSANYRKYTIEEIKAATNHFSNDLKIGEGGYGPVFRGILDHTPVAIKVLRPDISQGLQQFKQEVDVLGCMRHPNMVLLLGACPEYGCLVYEYMENGSLEDQLFRKNDIPPLSWQARFRIAAEIGTALLFLHQNKPEPLVHRDLKPANILIGQNYVSKIGDVGLAKLVPSKAADAVTQYHLTAAAGTFCYIDPEYQQTGLLGVKSDLYSLGVMLLQIITGRTAMGLSHQVEMAIENERFEDVLDPTVTDWPVKDTLSLAKIALQCCELRKRDRPDLSTVVLPELIRLRDMGSSKNKASRLSRNPAARRPYDSDTEVEMSTNQVGKYPYVETGNQNRSM